MFQNIFSSRSLYWQKTWKMDNQKYNLKIPVIFPVAILGPYWMLQIVSNTSSANELITRFTLILLFMFKPSNNHTVTDKPYFSQYAIAIRNIKNKKRNIIKSRQTKYTFFIPCLNVYYFREKCSLHVLQAKRSNH